MGVPITLLAFAFSLSAMSSTPRAMLPMLLLVRVAGAGLQLLQVILLGKVRIAMLPLDSRKFIGIGKISCWLMLTPIGFSFKLQYYCITDFHQIEVLHCCIVSNDGCNCFPFTGKGSKGDHCF